MPRRYWTAPNRKWRHLHYDQPTAGATPPQYNGNITSLTRDGGTAITYSYTYDALGTKLRSVGAQSAGQTRDYVGGFEYTGGMLDRIHTEAGYITMSGAVPTYHYYLRDHLGNVRSVLSPSGSSFTVIQQQDYYPYGMRKSLAGPTQNRYLYNGKEIQGELGGQYDYGARFYDPVIGRWSVVDPLAENHYEVSAYAYVLNNPLGYTDPFGLDTLSANTDYMQTYREGVDVVAIDEVIVTAPNRSGGRNYGGDGSGSLADKFMYGLDQVNQYLPTTHLLNSFSYAFTGGDILGNRMGFGEAMLGAASILPIGKIGGVAARGVGNIAAKTGTSLGAGRTGVKQWLQNAGNLERGTLIQNIESAGFKRMSPTTSPVSVFERGGMRIRLDPPQSGTPFNHMHLEYGGNSYNIFLNPVNYKSPAAHIPIR